MKKTRQILILLGLFSVQYLMAGENKLTQEAREAMLKATRYMVEEVSTRGGYLWYYLPDFSRQWGEMEAYKTMIWLQNPGTISMGQLFLDAYRTTGNEYYYQAAGKAAEAIIWGQSKEGGWNYMIDFAGDRSLKNWYATIGKNGWRLEEFQHYYGNCTFDDDVTSDAAKFLMRIYLEKLDPAYKPALDKAIGFILESQYPLGGWPQRYPLHYDFNKGGHPDYSSFYTFNDDVTWENVNFLIQCYQLLGEERFLDPIRRGMYFYLISQDACGGWAQQCDMSLCAAGARTYEPAALLPATTFGNAMLLLRFYQYTGNKKFLNQVPAAIHWLEEAALPEGKTGNGRYTHSTFVEPGSNKPLYMHRKGSNVIHGYYYMDENDDRLLAHYGGKTRIRIERLKQEYERLAYMPREELIRNSPLRKGQYDRVPDMQGIAGRDTRLPVPEKETVREIIRSLDSQGRWLSRHGMTSHTYVGDGTKTEPTDQYAQTMVGDETDTSPYRDVSDQEYISTSAFIRNMYTLIQFIRSQE
ncbi:MAG: pectate lyase [Mangrovibacterium sp.]